MIQAPVGWVRRVTKHSPGDSSRVPVSDAALCGMGAERGWGYRMSEGRRIGVSAAFPGFVALLALLTPLAFAACSKPESAEDAKPEQTSATETPGGCRQATAEGEAPSPACRDLTFVQAVRVGDFPELESLTDDQLTSFAHGLCAYADSIAAAPEVERPVYGDLVASTASSWGVPVATVDAVSQATRLMCPDGHQILARLSRSDSGIQVELSATGSGSADVSYMLPDGSTQNDQGASVPWSQTIYLPQVAALTVSVSPLDGASVGCRITVNGVVLDEEREANTPATCEVQSKDVDKAIIKGGSGD